MRAPKARYERRRRFVDGILNAVVVESYDLEVAHAHADLLAHVQETGRPRDAHDLIIAATAVARGRVVATTDRRGFDDLPGVEIRAP
jgi:tRNA(fMet)-specific endonuclease VapC